nr:hypothetical protein CFP56_39619 [Quercus suber]
MERVVTVFFLLYSGGCKSLWSEPSFLESNLTARPKPELYPKARAPKPSPASVATKLSGNTTNSGSKSIRFSFIDSLTYGHTLPCWMRNLKSQKTVPALCSILNCFPAFLQVVCRHTSHSMTIEVIPRGVKP